MPGIFPGATEFQKTGLAGSAAHSHGETRSYGWIAKQIGNLGQPRAVGSAG